MRDQEDVDRFYAERGPCCAGCDHWHWMTVGGQCTKSAPMSGEQRAAMLDLHGFSCRIGAGHAITPAGHVCGDFRDTFDWASLPIAYVARIGGRHLLP
jgi:hypothetical protein